MECSGARRWSAARVDRDRRRGDRIIISFAAVHESAFGTKQTSQSTELMSALGETGHRANLRECPLMTQSRHFDAGPTSNSITAGFRFIVAREIIHLRPTAFPSRENDYVRTIFISYPARHHRSRTRRVGSVALRAAGRRD